MRARFVACVLAIAVGILVSATASIVQATVIMDATHDNGWFTSPTVPASPGWSDLTTPTGWTVDGHSGTDFGVELCIGSSNQIVFMTPGGAATDMHQNNLYTVPSAGLLMDLTYYAGANSGQSPSNTGTIDGFLYLDSSSNVINQSGNVLMTPGTSPDIHTGGEFVTSTVPSPS